MKAALFDRRAYPRGAKFSIWQTPDGWPIRRMDWSRPKGGRARGSLIFAGGRGDFIEKYLEAFNHWRGRGWNVAAFDWRGQGESRGGIIGGHLDSFDPLVADGAALIESWIASSPGPHVAVGHSMGGHLMLRVFGERRPALAAAVLVAPMIAINSAPVPAWLGRQAAGFLADIGWSEQPAWKHNGPGAPTASFRQAHLTGSDERFADELWWKERHPGFELGAPSWGWMSAAYRSMARLTLDSMGAIKLPILLIGTDRDRLVSPAAIRRAAVLLPNAELHMFRDAAHELLRESEAVRLEAFARIDAFLDAHA